MAILNRFSTILLYCDSTLFLFLAANFWRFQARDSWNHAIRDSRFCAAKEPCNFLLVPNPAKHLIYGVWLE